MYDPVIARFISIDPVVKNIYDPQSINPYTYSLNNPLIYTDPNGKFAIPFPWWLFMPPPAGTTNTIQPPEISEEMKLTMQIAMNPEFGVVLGVGILVDKLKGADSKESQKAENEESGGNTSSGEEKENDKPQNNSTDDNQIKPTSTGKMQKEVERGQAPRDVERVDKPHVPDQESHVHFKDGTSSTQSGNVHDAHKGTPDPSKKTKVWLERHGWKPPTNSN